MIRKLFSSRIRINMLSGTITHCANAVVLILAYPIYLHFLGYETYGLWLALAAVLNLAQLGNLGIGTAVTKLVAEDHGQGDIRGIESYITMALMILTFSGVIIFILIVCFKMQIIAAFRFNEENRKLASWLLLYIGLLSIYMLFNQVLTAALSGLGRMDLANYIESGGRIIAVTIASVLLYTGRGIESLVIGNAIAYGFVHIASVLLIRRMAKIRFVKVDHWDKKRLKKLLHFGSGIFGGSIINLLGSPFHKLVLARYAGTDVIPIYDIAFRGSMQIRALVEVGLRALMPEVSRIGIEKTAEVKKRIVRLYRRSIQLIFVGAGPLYLLLMLLAGPLLILWLRERFVESIPLAFRIMLCATFVSLIGVPAYYFLLGLGHIRDVFTARCITWVSNSVFVAFIALFTTWLTPANIGWCLLISWALSCSFLLWRFGITLKAFQKVNYE